MAIKIDIIGIGPGKEGEGEINTFPPGPAGSACITKMTRKEFERMKNKKIKCLLCELGHKPKKI